MQKEPNINIISEKTISADSQQAEMPKQDVLNCFDRKQEEVYA